MCIMAGLTVYYSQNCRLQYLHIDTWMYIYRKETTTRMVE